MPAIIIGVVPPSPDTDVPALPTDSYMLQAQRTAWEVEPGFLPGAAAFDGTEGGAFGASADDVHNVTTIKFVGLFRGGARGTIIPTGSTSLADMPVTRVSRLVAGALTPETPPVSVGVFHPRSSGFAWTTTAQEGLDHNAGDGDNAPSGVGNITTNRITAAGALPTEAFFSPRTREFIHERFWLTNSMVPPGVLCVAASRQWLHVAEDVRIRTYHTLGGGALSAAFVSGDHPVDTWLAMEADDRPGGFLFAIAKSGGELVLCKSRDGGITIEEVWRVTGTKGALCMDSERQALIVLYTDTTIKRRISRDGGATWESAASVHLSDGTTTITADVLAVDHNERGGGTTYMLVKDGSNQKMYASRDQGALWKDVTPT